MLLENLLQYGALGVVSIYFMFDKKSQGEKIIDVINRNTEALGKIAEVMRNCQALNGKK